MGTAAGQKILQNQKENMREKENMKKRRRIQEEWIEEDKNRDS